MQDNELIKKAQGGDIEARNKIIEDNIMLLRKIIFNFTKTFSTVDEYLAVAFEASIKAIERYDASRGMKLSTLIAVNIRNALLRNSYNNQGVIAVPEYLQVKVSQHKRLNNGNITDDKIMRLASSIPREVSTDADINYDASEKYTNATKLVNLKVVYDFDEQIDAKKKFGAIYAALISLKLSDKERYILFKRIAGAKLQELANEYKVSREYIRIVHDKILIKIRRKIEFQSKGYLNGKIDRGNKQHSRFKSETASI